MKLCLKKYAKLAGSQTIVVTLHDRVPARVSSLPELTCVFQIEACSDYYLLTLDVTAKVDIACQRCLADFQHEYKNQTTLAVCTNDDVAETLMEHYECIVTNNGEIDLIEILTDEMHLFLPEKHHTINDCDLEVSQLIGDKS